MSPITLDYAIDNYIAIMGELGWTSGEFVLDARELEKKYGDPYTKLHEIFTPIAEKRGLRIWASEERDDPILIRYDVHTIRRIERSLPDRYRIQWVPQEESSSS